MLARSASPEAEQSAARSQEIGRTEPLPRKATAEHEASHLSLAYIEAIDMKVQKSRAPDTLRMIHVTRLFQDEVKSASGPVIRQSA